MKIKRKMYGLEYKYTKTRPSDFYKNFTMSSALPVIAEIDDNFGILYKNLNGLRNDDNQTLIITLTRFRKNVSFQWLNSFTRVNPHICLSTVISTILGYTENSDATVRVNAYSTLGALLLCVAPFSPLLFIRAFGHATSQLPVSPKMSVAIINMFVYLSRFVSPVRITEFVSMVPVVHHFGVDVSDYIQHLPQIIPLMKVLPVEFHQNILRSILVSCGRKPNYAFANSVFLLIQLNKEQLTKDCLSFCAGNNLEDAIVWLGPFLLADDEIYDIMGVENHELFLSNAIKIFMRPKPQLSLFEYSCKIANIFLKKSRGTDLHEAIHTRIYTTIPENLSIPFKAKLLNLPTPISEIKLEAGDADSLKGAKLNAAVTYFLDKFNIDNVDADQVAEFFIPYKESENDLYCTFVDAFGTCITELLKRCKKTIHIELLDFILRKKNKNWVHDETVCKMIDRIPLSIVMKQMPTYQDLVFDRLLEYALSTTDRLFNSAIDSIIKVASYSNINDLLSRIFKSDWLSDAVSQRRFRLLACLSKLFRTSAFQQFVDIAYESILEYDNISLLSNAYDFLSHIPIDHMPDELRDFSFEFIAKQYQSFSHRKMDYPQNHYDVPMPPGSFVETLDTDIVANPSFDHVTVMEPVMNCFSFLYSIPRALLVDTDTLFWDSFYLVPILGHYALDAARTLISTTSPYYDHLWNLGLETFKATSKDEVSASCVKLFTNCPKPLPPVVNEMLQKYLSTVGTAPELIFLAFIIVDQNDHELAMAGVNKLLGQLESVEACKILFKLVHVMGSSLIKEIKDEHAPALLQYACDIGEPFSTRVLNYFQTTPLDVWPVGDPEMDACTYKLLSKHDRIKLDEQLLARLDRQHWDFVIVYNTIFDLEFVPKFIEENPDTFAKIDVSFFAAPPPPPEPFEFKPVTDKLKIASIQPNVKRGEFIEDLALIESLCSSGRIKVSNEIFDKMYNLALQNEHVKTMKAIIDYSLRQEFNINLDELLQHKQLCLDDKIFPLVIQLPKKPIKEFPQPLLELCEEKVGEKIVPELILKAESNESIMALIKVDPNFFVQYVIDIEEYRAHRLLKVLPLMNNILIDADQLAVLITRTLPIYIELTSNRKKIVFLRFVATALTCIKAQRKTALFQTILVQANNRLPDILVDITASMLFELTNLITVILPTVPSSDNIYRCVIHALGFGTTSMYTWLLIASALSNMKGETFPCLAQQNFEAIMTHGLPSLRANGLRALALFLLPTSAPKAFQLVSALAIHVYNNYENFNQNFRTAQAVILLLSRILVSANCDQIPVPFFSGFVNNFIAKLTSPQFTMAVSLFPQLSLRVGKLFESLLSSPYCSYEVTEAVRETYRVLSDAGKRTKDQMFFDYLERIEKFFLKYPTFENGQILLKVIADGGENVDAPSYLYSKLPMIVTNFIPLFQTLVLFYKDAKPMIKESCDVIVESMGSVIQPASRGQALRLLVGGGDIQTATALAAAELDDMSKVDGL